MLDAVSKYCAAVHCIGVVGAPLVGLPDESPPPPHPLKAVMLIAKAENLMTLEWLGLAWLGLAWLGLAWLGLAWLGLAC